MSIVRKSLLKTLALSLCALFVASASAAPLPKTNPQISVKPTARITEKVDVTKVTTLTGTHPALVDGLADMGRVDASTPAPHVLIVLKSSDEQEFALQALLDQQQDKSHPNYHQWVTPETFGAAFGVEASDIEKVKGWLQQAGFTINSVSKSGRLIDVSGTVGAVESAFQTQIHQYTVSGELRVSNSTDISIPSALTKVVAGPATLNNFRPVSHAVHPRIVKLDHGKPVSATDMHGKPDIYFSPYGANFVGATDLQLMYDALPLYAKGIDGTGQTIGIIAETELEPADQQIYRSIFGLSPAPPVVVHTGNDPGISAGDDTESDLDVEMAGSLAYNATVQFIIGGVSYFGDGVFTSVAYAVDANQVDVMSMSYGEGETASNRYGYLTFFNNEFEQAAAQGQTSFVSSGDSGPNSNGGTTTPTSYSVTGWGDSPYTVSVGGTEFNESLDVSGTTFWGPGSATPPYENALAYPPEVPWNQWPVYGDGTQSGSEGSSGVSAYFNTPSYQTGPGVPTTDPTPGTGSFATGYFKTAGTNHRYLPDISSNASDDLDGTVFCSEGSCLLNPDGTLASIGVVGGTSVSAPTMASAQALINQANGGRQGQANYYYYRIAASQGATPAGLKSCSSTTYVTTGNSTCGFHDVVNGDTYEPTNSTTIPYIGWPTNPGYDLSVGLGSPDIANLAALWSTVTFNGTTTKLTLSPTTTQTHGTAYTATIVITPLSSTTKIPTGNISLYATTATGAPVNGFTSVPFIALSGTSNTVTASITGLPAGAINVYAHYTGDTTFGGSTSAPVALTITPEAPKVLLTSYSLSTAGALTATSAFTYGQTVFLQGGVNPSSGAGVPTGNTTFGVVENGTTTLPSLTVPLEPVTSLGNQITTNGPVYVSDSALVSGNGGEGIIYNYPLLGIGTYAATYAYAGDASFNAGSATPITFTVGPAATALTVTPATTVINSGATAVINASIAIPGYLDGAVAPTGSITFTDTTNTAAPVTLPTLSKFAAVTSGASVGGSISTNLITGTGVHTITAVYSGDANYASVTKTTTITIGGAASLLVLTSNASGAQVLTPITFTATIPASLATTGVTTGTVYVYDSGLQIGTIALGSGASTGTTTLTTLAAGTHTITGTFSGTSVTNKTTGITTIYNAGSTSAPITIVIGKNTPQLQLSVENNNSTNTSKNTAMNGTLFLNPDNSSGPPNYTPFAAVPKPTGQVTFTDAINGAKAVSLGSSTPAYQGGFYEYYIASLVTSGGLVPGYHVLSANYPGDANYAAAASNTDTVGIGLTSTTLTIVANGSGSNATLTVVASVFPLSVLSTNPTLTGTVSFYTNSVSKANLISTATVSSANVASVTIPYPGVQETVIAVYSGDANYYTSTSTASTLAGYIITVPSGSYAMSATGSVTVPVTATSFGGYAGTGSLSCSNLPANTFCPFNAYQQFTFSGTDGSQTIGLIITAINSQAGATPVKAGLIWLPSLMLSLLLLLGRKKLTLRGRQMLVLVILLSGMMAVSGCSSSSSANNPSNTITPKGTYTVTLTSNGAGANTYSPNLTTGTTFTLQVQ